MDEKGDEMAKMTVYHGGYQAVETPEIRVNKYTKETIYQLRLECNDMNLDVCINKEDLLGEPEVGRRFKGTIWLQGHINFAN